MDHKLKVGLSRLVLSSGVEAAAAYGGVTAGTGFLIYGAGWLGQVVYGNITANRLLPKVAKSASWFTINNTPSSGLDAATRIPELVPIDDRFTKINGFAAYNFQFHRDYGAAIQKYYFGNERILFRNNQDDLKIYNSMHDAYYERLGLSQAVDTERACISLIEKVRANPISPMISWLTLPIEEIEACQVYRDLDFQTARARQISRLLSPEKSDDPFHTGLPGSEGSRTDLTVLPQLQIDPIDE